MGGLGGGHRDYFEGSILAALCLRVARKSPFQNLSFRGRRPINPVVKTEISHYNVARDDGFGTCSKLFCAIFASALLAYGLTMVLIRRIPVPRGALLILAALAAVLLGLLPSSSRRALWETSLLARGLRFFKRSPGS